MQRATHLGIVVGTLAGAALLVHAVHAGGWDAALTASVAVACGAAVGYGFGHRERDVAFTMPYAAGAAALGGAFLVPFVVFFAFVLLLALTGHLHVH